MPSDRGGGTRAALLTKADLMARGHRARAFSSGERW